MTDDQTPLAGMNGAESSGQAAAAPAPRAASGNLGAALKRYAARFDDGLLLRWAFFGMLAGTATVLAMDFHDLSRVAPAQEIVDPMTIATPILPPADDSGEPEQGEDPRRFLKTDETMLRRPMQFTLGGGGALLAEGSIEPGTAARLAAELEARGEYVKTVSLNSPGGALDDAMEMGRLVRARGLDTKVADGSLCASSCPLFLAGGKHRWVGETAAVGVHQFYALSTPDQAAPAPGQALSEAQTTTAKISRYLDEMGVDTGLWLHALDTPPRALYYLSDKELSQYKLATGIAKPEAVPGAAHSG